HLRPAALQQRPGRARAPQRSDRPVGDLELVCDRQNRAAGCCRDPRLTRRWRSWHWRSPYRLACGNRKGLALMPWVASEGADPRNHAFVRSGFVLSRIARLLPGLETKHAFGVGLETLAPYGVISDFRASGHSYVGHPDIDAVPFGLSLSGCVSSHCDT